ncbi:MAG: hypothetical protein AB1847_23325, partial [bacterium]
WYLEKAYKMLNVLSIMIRYLFENITDSFVYQWERASGAFKIMKEGFMDLLAATGHFFKAGFYAITGQMQKAAEEFQKAKELVTRADSRELPPGVETDADWEQWRKSRGRKTLQEMLREYEAGFKKPSSSSQATPPGIGGRPSQEELEKQAKAAAKLAEAQEKYEEALGKARIERLQSEQTKEKAILDDKYKTGLISAEEYYSKLAEMAKTLTQNEIAELEKQKEAIKKTYEADLAAAKTEKEKATVTKGYQTEIIKLDAEIAKKRADLDLQTIQLTQKRNDELRGLEEKQADAEIKFQEQLGEDKLSILRADQEAEKALLEQKHQDHLISDADYYARQIEMAKALTAAEIAELEKRQEAIRETYEFKKISATLDEQKIIDQEMLTEIDKVNTEIVLRQKNLAIEIGRLEQAKREQFRQTAEALKSSFSDILFDAFTGKLKSFEDYWKSFWNSMARIMSNELAKGVYQQLMGSGSSGSGNGLYYAIMHGIGTLFSSSSSPSTGSTTAGSSGGLSSFSWQLNTPKMASGGIVTKPTLAYIGEAGPEAVVPLGKKSPLSSGSPVVIVNINAVDAKSFADMARRNPGAILGPFKEALNRSGDMRYSILDSLG